MTDPFLVQLCNAVAARLKAEVSTRGLQALPFMISAPNPPTLWVMGLEQATYHEESMGGALWELMLMGITTAGFGDESAQRILYGWQSHDGPESVARALEERIEDALDELVDDVTVRSCGGTQIYVLPELNGARLGTDFKVEIRTS